MSMIPVNKYRDLQAVALAEDLMRAACATETGARQLLDKDGKGHIAQCCYDEAEELIRYANDCAETPRKTKQEK